MNNPARRPFLGEDTHYVSYGTPGGEYSQQCRAAKVTATCDQNSQACSLVVFNPTGLFFHTDIPHDEQTRAGGTWHFAH